MDLWRGISSYSLKFPNYKNIITTPDCEAMYYHWLLQIPQCNDNFIKWHGIHLGLKHIIQALILDTRNEFSHFVISHNEKPFLKSIFNEVWIREAEMLNISCSKFRENVSLSPYFIRYWQLASNKFTAKSQSSKKVISIIPENLDEIITDIMSSKYKSLCINDVPSCSDEFYIRAKQMISQAFDVKFPDKSTFEK